ncbi:MAG: 23S rRNA (adenine(2030)-N(6))-methyltransferase RlmJ [Steroidobacter sp.]
MNYRHAFHAGNFADVHKHVVLLALLERLRRKPKPLFYLDTHAGRGWYDLHSPEALRSDEWRSGVARLVNASPASEDIRRYLQTIDLSPDSMVNRYPGSPLLVSRQLRDIDRIVLVEQQIAEAQALDRTMHSRRGASVVCGDGYASLKTYLPPRENRGLVLIDPPYESDREFAQAQQAMQFGLNRWPNGVFALWFPIKANRESHKLQATMRGAGLRKLLLLELTVRPADSPIGLNGSGMVVANPPWQFEEEMRSTLEELHALLDPARDGGSRVEWLAEE